MGAVRRGKASMNIGRSTERGLTRRDFLKIGGVGLAGATLFGGAACGGSRSSGAVELTFWSWVPDIQNEIQLFEEAHPNIKIKYINAGQVRYSTPSSGPL
jgi:multiple sugar transport system substrate-binding protein